MPLCSASCNPSWMRMNSWSSSTQRIKNCSNKRLFCMSASSKKIGTRHAAWPIASKACWEAWGATNWLRRSTIWRKDYAKNHPTCLRLRPWQDLSAPSRKLCQRYSSDADLHQRQLSGRLFSLEKGKSQTWLHDEVTILASFCNLLMKVARCSCNRPWRTRSLASSKLGAT